MTDVIVLCVDGSDLSTKAIAAGLALVRPALVPVLVTVIEPVDPTLLTGTGFAGGTMSPEAFEAEEKIRQRDGEALLTDVAATLGLADAERRVVEGGPGAALCQVAEELEAHAIVIGSRGRSGFKRAVLGSVSDHVVRHAPCPVIVVGQQTESED